MLHDRAFEDFLDLLYAAPSHPELWGEVLGGLVDLVGGDSAWMARLVDVGEGGDGQTCRLDASAQVDYFNHYERLDPFRDRRSQPLGVFDDEAYLAKAELTRSEFYNDFMRPLGAHSILKLRLFNDGRSSSVIHLNRSRQRGAFDRDPVATATRLFPHLARATRLHAVLRDAEIEGRRGPDLLATIRKPAMLLDGRGRIHASNAAAAALLDEGRPLAVRDGLLVATSAAAGRALHLLLARTAAPDGRPSPGGTLPIDRGVGRLPLLLTLTPLAGGSAKGPPGLPTLLLTIGDPDDLRLPHPSLLVEMFRLTTAEGKVALDLMKGLSIHAIAAKGSVSLNTTRNHVKTIFAKTGVSRQGELVALLMRIASAV